MTNDKVGVRAEEHTTRVIPTESREAGRAEEPLSKTSGLLDNPTSAYLNILFRQMTQSDDLMFVYLMASNSGTLYLGVTNNLIRRVHEHRTGLNKSFSKKYSCRRLIYFEIHDMAGEAIEREKQIKRWRREKKEHLICTLNPKWLDLALMLPDNNYAVEDNARDSSARPPSADSVGMTFGRSAFDASSKQW